MSPDVKIFMVPSDGEEVIQEQPFWGKVDKILIFADRYSRPLLAPNHGDEWIDELGMTYAQLQQALKQVSAESSPSL